MKFPKIPEKKIKLIGLNEEKIFIIIKLKNF